jgi:hypothetical protein
MIELKIEGGTLDLLPDTVITIEEHSPAYLGENVQVLEGEYSYPFTLPLTMHNRQLLGYPDRLDNGQVIASKIPAQLYLGGNLHIDGLLYLEEPSRSRVKVYIAANSLLNIKDTPLPETTEKLYDLGADNAEILDHMLTVSQDPLSYDYTFFPVYNKTITDDDTAGEEYDETRYHNCWLPNSTAFTADGPVAPFPRLEVVLDEVMANTGYAFQNNWQTDEQLRRLVLINNRDLRDEDTGDIAPEILLASLLEDKKAGEFIRDISRLFCLAPFLDRRRRTIRLEPLIDLLNSDTRLDWTAYTSREYSYTQGQAALNRLAYPAEAYEESPGDFWKADQDQSEYTIEGLPEISDPYGLYYDYAAGDIRKYGEARIASGTRPYFLFKARHFGAIDNEAGTEQNLPGLYPIFSGWANPPAGSSERWMVPKWYTSTAAEGDDVKMRLAFHWGNGTGNSGSVFPFGSWNDYEFPREVYPGSQYSLAWEGPYGLYEKWWREWDLMLRSGKLVTRNFLLPPQEINRFTFDQKVRVENKDYFVRSLRYQVSLRGISEVQIKLISIF